MYLSRLFGVIGAGFAMHLTIPMPLAFAQQGLDCGYAETRAQTQFISSAARADMIAAAERGDWPTVHAAILMGGDPEDTASSSLYRDALYVRHGMVLVSAAAVGDMGVIKEILAQDPVAANFSNSDGWMTPLFWAASCGRYDATDALLRAGANVNVPIGFTVENGAQVTGVTPLMAAARAGHLDIVYLLLRNGADPNLQATTLPPPGSQEKSAPWWTPLLVSANTDVTSALLKFGADPNLLQGDGLSPLAFMASEGRDPDCARLLHAGADRSIRYNGHTPSELAAMAGHNPTAKLIDHWHYDAEILADETAFLEALQQAVRADDRQWVADHLYYPVRINTNKGSRYVENKRAFLSQYDAVLSPHIIRVLLKQSPRDLFSNWQGTMIGRGEIWFSAFSEFNDVGSPGYRIYTFNEASIPGEPPD